MPPEVLFGENPTRLISKNLNDIQPFSKPFFTIGKMMVKNTLPMILCYMDNAALTTIYTTMMY